MRLRFRLQPLARGALLAASLFTVSTDARADLFGVDVGVLTQILAESIQQVAYLIQAVGQLGTQIQLMETTLSRLDGRSYDGIQHLLTDTSNNFSALTRDINAVGYTLDDINRNYRTAFPSTYQMAPTESFEGTRTRWQNEVLSSALVAARAQSELAALQSNTDQAVAIVSASRGAPGEVAQLQAVVQMLGVMQSQMKMLVEDLVTVGRVQTNAAAAAASDRQMSREIHRRNLLNYTDRGAPVPVMTTLPAITMP